jgi:hypothetical protein
MRLTSPHKNVFVEKLLKLETTQKQQRQPSMYKDLQIGMWNMLSVYRSSTVQNLIQVTEEY